MENALRDGHPGGRLTDGLTAVPVRLFDGEDGPGIPPLERERVFEPFYRPRHSTSGGCGLGLTIAREIAARHGAQLTIADPPHGRGTRIEVIFAAAPALLKSPPQAVVHADVVPIVT